MSGTQVIIGITAGGSYITKNIEDLQEGDLVLARDQYDEGGGVELREVVRLFRKTSDHLRVVRIQDADGNVETIRTTDEHPFWVAGIGWVAAKDLRAGDRLNEADDSNDAVVLSSIREGHPDGVAVYNFEVAGDHTYFIEDGYGAQTAIWVHNTCAGKNHFVLRSLGSKTPYGHSSLRYLNEFRHTKLHRRLNQFLRKQTKVLPNGKVVDMMPRRGNPGNMVQQHFTRAEREAALKKFYTTYNNGEYYSDFVSDLSVAKANSWW